MHSIETSPDHLIREHKDPEWEIETYVLRFCDLAVGVAQPALGVAQPALGVAQPAVGMAQTSVGVTWLALEVAKPAIS